MEKTRVAVALLGSVLLVGVPFGGGAGADEQKSTRMTCGKCPAGYATTGVTSEPSICKDGDPTLVQCVPIGSMPLLAVCGSCPEGYVEVGSSRVPARCGTLEEGRLTQCQATDLGKGLPDPTQGGVFCPPNCAGQMPTPGQGAIPPPPKFPPSPEKK